MNGNIQPEGVPPGSRIRQLFTDALARTNPDERRQFLADACGANEKLHALVLSLLEAHEQAGAFLGQGLVEERSSPPAAERVGDRIGRYRLLQKIGEGGCGVVYMAEQDEPVRRRVALKVIKAGMDTRSVIGRFEAERQALALMDHPNIAKVLDAGATETGRPYFVMELVRGIKVTDYCDQHHLSASDRLDLFLQICRAVQHAHQKGIIHRDIKPSNILVTLHDGIPVPKVIDFGIAKATTDQRLTDKTLFTAFEQFVGTPAYMSPEQAEMSALDVDTRSDIYSLGVLLYELLTGKTPFEAKDLMQAGLDAMRRTIREKEPSRPSTRLSSMVAADLATVAQHRQTDGPKLISILRGDLDWIVMKALEKDRTRRYETANGLALDIQRYVNNEAVLARPRSRLYRFQKTVRRNKLAFAAAAIVVGTMLVSLIITRWQFIDKSKAYRRAVLAEHEQSRLRAQAQAAQASEMEERKSAQAAGARLAESLNRLELQKVEELFSAGDSSAALAYLARMLRQNPADRIAAERLLSALSYRNFALRVVEPLKHESAVSSAHFSGDGQRIVTASAKTVQIWDAATGRPIAPPIQHDGTVTAAFLSPDGQRVATAFHLDIHAIGQPLGPSFVRVWDANTGEPLIEPIKFQGDDTTVQFSPDGKRLLTPSSFSTRVWDAKTGQPLTPRPKDGRQVLSAQFSPDGTRIVTASADKIAQVWNVETGEPIGAPLRSNGPVVSARFSGDGQAVVTASGNVMLIGGGTRGFGTDADAATWEARVWDAKTGQPLTPPIQHSAGIIAADFSPDGLRVVTASRDGTARIWSARTGQPLTEPLRHQSAVISAQFSPDGQRLVTGSWDKTARVWEARTGRPLTEPLRHDAWLCGAEFSPDGARVLTASLDRTARVWDARIRETLTESITHLSLVSTAEFSPDGQRVLTSSYDNGKVWNPATGKSMKLDGGFFCAVFDPKGERLATDVQNGARLWDATTGEPLTERLAQESHVDSVQFSPDGRRVATASQDNTARVWVAQTGQPLTEPLKHDAVVWSARFSPDGRTLLTASADGTAKIWDAATGRLLTKPLKHEGSVLTARFSADGKRIVTASMDKTARIWDAQTGQQLVGPLQHEDGLMSAEFSPDDRWVVTASEDNTARVWDAQTGKPVTVPLQHHAGLRSAQSSPDGQRIVTASWDKTARLWDARSGQPLSEPLPHNNAVALAHFSPDGKQIVTASTETVRLWEVPVPPLPVPDWLPGLTEAIAEKRLDDQGISYPAPLSELEAFKGKLGQGSSSNLWNRWVQWFFADPATRSISPFSAVSVHAYVQRQIEESNPTNAPTFSPNEYLHKQFAKLALERLQEAVQLAPTNGLALARLARAVLAQDPKDNPTQMDEALWLTQRAVQYAPGEPEAFAARAEAMERRENFTEALKAINAAIQIQPNEPAYTKLQGRIREEANRK